MTRATSGPPGSGSSASAVLQRSLASRLQAVLDANGSPEYVLTWKEWAMPSGPPICALRAWQRRTSDSGFSGWPTCKSMDGLNGLRTVEGALKEFLRKGTGADLPTIAALAGWISPAASDGNGGKGPRKGVSPTGKLPDGSKAHMDLSAFTKLQLAGWASPKVGGGSESLEKFRKRQEVIKARHPDKGMGIPLDVQVLLASGTPSTSSAAETASCGALNPAHARWLIGFPAVWDAYAPTGTR